MQRSNHGEPPAPLTPASGFMFPGYPTPPAPTWTAPPAARMWPNLAELLNALKRRMVLATFLGVLVGMAAAAGVWLAMPAGKHQVRALIQVRPADRMVGRPVGMDQEFESFKQTQMTLLKGRSLLNLVVGHPNVSRQPEIRNADDPVRYLEEAIRLKWESPEMLAVTMNGDDPKQLKAIMDVLVEEYIKDAQSEEGKGRERRRRVVQAQIAELDKRIKYAEDTLEQLVRTNQGPNPDSNLMKIKLLTEQIQTHTRGQSDTKQQIHLVTSELNRWKAKLAEVEHARVEPDELEAVVSRNVLVKARIKERDDKRLAVEKLEQKFLPDHPALMQEKDELKRLEAEVAAMVEKYRPAAETEIRGRLRREYQSSVNQEADKLKGLTDLLDYHEKEIARLNKEMATTNRATLTTITNLDDLKPMKDQRSLLQNELIQLDMADKVEPRVQKREDAVVILNQNLRQKVLLSIATFLAGLGLVMTGVAFLEWRSRRVDSVDQVVNELGMRVLGTIPAFPSKSSLRSADPAQAQNWRFVLNESVNSARTMLLHTAKTQSMQVIMVSSATQGEGKTSLASQLATSMAAAGLRTLILDCDLRNPSMHKLFDSPLNPGCAEVLLQEVDVSDAVQPTTVPNLWLIPAGQCSNRVISALAQGHPLETLFNRLRGQFDFIVVDTCPILPVADALLVGQHVDGVVISVLQDISQLPKVLTASEKLTQLNIPLLGAVVNGIKPDVHAYGYNYVKQLPA